MVPGGTTAVIAPAADPSVSPHARRGARPMPDTVMIESEWTA